MGLHDILAQVAADRADRKREPDKPISASRLARQAKMQAREARRQEDHALELRHARALAQARYHAKNKEHLNRVRALRARIPTAVYHRARRRAELRGQQWDFDFHSWWNMWQSAPRVLDYRTGFFKPAWECKGGVFFRDTQMMRRDPSGPWSVENCFIGINGKELLS